MCSSLPAYLCPQASLTSGSVYSGEAPVQQAIFLELGWLILYSRCWGYCLQPLFLVVGYSASHLESLGKTKAQKLTSMLFTVHLLKAVQVSAGKRLWASAGAPCPSCLTSADFLALSRIKAVDFHDTWLQLEQGTSLGVGWTLLLL